MILPPAEIANVPGAPNTFRPPLMNNRVFLIAGIRQAVFQYFPVPARVNEFHYLDLKVHLMVRVMLSLLYGRPDFC